MSRVGKKKISIPSKVKVSYKDKLLTVQGEKGTLTRLIHQNVDLIIDNEGLSVTKSINDKNCDAIQGLTRSLVFNMITGVNQGFERSMEINGIGYRAESKGDSIVLNIGYSHPVTFKLPSGISASVDKNLVKLKSIDKEALGQVAAAIRRLRPPEPYKGKGIKFVEEIIQRKAGKTGAK